MYENCHFKSLTRDVNRIFFVIQILGFLHGTISKPLHINTTGRMYYVNRWLLVKPLLLWFISVMIFCSLLKSDGNIFVVFQFLSYFFCICICRHKTTFAFSSWSTKRFPGPYRTLKSSLVCIQITKLTEIWLSIWWYMQAPSFAAGSLLLVLGMLFLPNVHLNRWCTFQLIMKRLCVDSYQYI